jgi:hypothetical protein
MTVSDSVRGIVNRVRGKSQQIDSKDLPNRNQTAHPAEPPPDDQQQNYPPPLNNVHLPLILPEHQFNLAVQGWTTLTFPESCAVSAEQQRADTIRKSVQSLFAAGHNFFERETEYKSQFLTKQGSEDGWNSIPGEKEFITVRRLSHVPDEIKGPAAEAWAAFGDLLMDTLTEIAKSLGLEPEALVRFARPCSRLEENETATMLRIFRYETWEDKVVAEAHNDLGLLSLVVGSSPGLEVYSPMIRSYYPIEKSYLDLNSTGTLLVGRQLQRFSNGRYAPGGHRVMSYPKHHVGANGNGSVEKKYRFSVVFVLRAHYDEVIDVKSLCSPITGQNQVVTDGESARQFFTNIRSSYYNINTNIKERDAQKKHINQKKQQMSQTTLSSANGSIGVSDSTAPEEAKPDEKPLGPGTG